MGKKSGFGIRDEHPGSYFGELRNNFFGLKYLNSLMRIPIRDPEFFLPWIRDPSWKNSDPGSGINIPDPQYWLYINNLCLGSGGQAEHTAPQQREHSTQIRS
jgi:hypothetical protein